MASLTPLSKGLIGLAVVGAMASAVWHLALKERLAGDAPSAGATVTAPPEAAAPGTTSAPQASAPVELAASGPMTAAEHAEQGRRFMESNDLAQARSHLEQAVQAGDAGAACLLGEMTLKGQGGIAADQAAAAKLFQFAQSRNIICFTAGQ